MRRLARWPGRTSCDSISEKMRTGIAISGITRQICASAPCTLNIGRNAAMVVITAAKTGVRTDLLPRSAAASGDRVLPRSCMMFSPTTIASSTTMPRTSKNTNSEIMFKETPVNGRTAMAPRNATGMPTATQMASLNCKNRASISRTMTPPIMAFCSSRLMRPRRITDSSRQVVISTPCGSMRWPAVATQLRTASVMVRAF